MTFLDNEEGTAKESYNANPTMNHEESLPEIASFESSN
jgi:hypothetical protein